MAPESNVSVVDYKEQARARWGFRSMRERIYEHLTSTSPAKQPSAAGEPSSVSGNSLNTKEM